MDEHSLNEYQRYLVEEFAEEYRESRMSRRDLLRRVLLVTGNAGLAASTLAVLGCGDGDEAELATVPVEPSVPTPPAVSTQAPTGSAPAPAATATPAGIDAKDIRFPGPASELLGYLAQPAGEGRYPGIIVIHENRGLVEHIRDVARRYAVEGFVAIAVDLVSRGGGSQQDTAQNTGFLGRASPEDIVADLQAYVAYVEGQAKVRRGGVGVTGFCLGGGYTWEAAVAIPEVKAAAPYYGTCRLIDQLSKTRAAIFAVYGERDTRITAQAEQVRAALLAAGKTFEIAIYPGANHAFFNDTGANYNADAARDAWARTLEWFRKHLPAS